tara:strand:+ start:147 stop:512 length:366 start_codon:yes stop_codon:yes gene_type:complete
MSNKTQTSLKTILLDAININLSSSTYDHPILNNKDYKNWSNMEKFQWAYDRYMIEVGTYESLEYWLSGLALPVPYMNYEIEQLGFNPNTFFKDLGNELMKITGYKDYPTTCIDNAIKRVFK